MDIHRCRFVLYPPAPINTLAFSHPQAQTSAQAAIARLAIGRDNGDIEIWNPLNGTWLQEKVIRGGPDRSVDGLVWVTEPDQKLADGKVVTGRVRLFSIGSSSTITEWDLVKGVPKRHATGNHGEIWCLAAQPVSAKKSKQDAKTGSEPASLQQTTRLVAGTIKGELISYSIEDDTLRFDKVLVRSQTKKHQLLSISFADRNTAVVGCSDSALRVYDLRKGMMLKTMTLGADLAGGASDIIVWSVKCLPGGDIVSADSTGQICIWDSKTFTLAQRLQSHDSDALSLAVSADGSQIVSGGMDKRTIYYKKVARSNRWSKVWSRRYHDHDVKAMATFEAGKNNIIVSGGTHNVSLYASHLMSQLLISYQKALMAHRLSFP
jgi:U3 small nucleolar RNA-associated protein 4